MWGRQILLGFLGLSAGAMAAVGLFSFIIELGVVSDFADRTHTADKVLLYEDSAALGGILGNCFFLFHLFPPGGRLLLILFGVFAGIFVGCWAMALAEALEVFPIFVRRTKLVRCVSWLILCTALGKGLGEFWFFAHRW